MGAKLITAVVGGVVALGVTIPLAGSASAAPTPSGASIVVQQEGVTVNRVCADDDVVLVASGFAPSRREVDVTIQIVGSGALFGGRIALTDGSGSWDTGSPGPAFAGDKIRARFQTGSTSKSTNNGSFSALIVDCV